MFEYRFTGNYQIHSLIRFWKQTTVPTHETIPFPLLRIIPTEASCNEVSVARRYIDIAGYMCEVCVTFLKF